MGREGGSEGILEGSHYSWIDLLIMSLVTFEGFIHAYACKT